LPAARNEVRQWNRREPPRQLLANPWSEVAGSDADGKSRTASVSGTSPKGKKFKNVAVYDKQ